MRFTNILTLLQHTVLPMASAANISGKSGFLIGCMVFCLLRLHVVFLDSICTTNTIRTSFSHLTDGTLQPFLTCSPLFLFPSLLSSWAILLCSITSAAFPLQDKILYVHFFLSFSLSLRNSGTISSKSKLKFLHNFLRQF